MFAKARSVAVIGMDGHPVDVEVQVAPGLPAFTVVGLGDAAVQEARERVRAAVTSSKERWPDQRVTVNLSPAHLRKAGSGFDLAIALAILGAVDRLPRNDLAGVYVVGELSLDGRVRKIRGALAAAAAAAGLGGTRILVPAGNRNEAALSPGIEVVGVSSLVEAAEWLRGEVRIAPTVVTDQASPASDADEPDLSEVRGHLYAKRVLEIAAAGGHNLLMEGAPGGGKTMLARRLPSILPALEHAEAMEVTRIYSVAGLLGDEAGLIRRRPFRAPHHSVSTAGLVGGGSGVPSPGEVSLAHRGVLFLDEAAEFRRDSLQALRQPVEDGRVRLTRARFAVTYPSRVQLVLATNPCPCGHFLDQAVACECRPGQLAAYRERLSGPIMDRIDLTLHVDRIGRTEIFAAPPGDESEIVAQRVLAARERQAERLRPYRITTNAEVPPRLLIPVFRPTPAALAVLESHSDARRLTMRGTHRVLRVGRTVADLDGADTVEETHVREALNMRVRDRG